jgi:tRNA-2-methylthio-N6-dimethylallyladenosine synthase
MKKAYIRTFGCQMNVHDSEKMAGLLREEGYLLTEDRGEADLIVFNTCSVREKAEQKFLSELGKVRPLKGRKPDLRVAVAGCVAEQMKGEIFKRAPHVDFVLGPRNLQAVREVASGGSGLAVGENPELAGMELPVERRERHRAWVSIMYGCDNFCSYCIVPMTRGRETSRPSGSIVEEVRKLAADGCREVTLLGQNVNSYRSDVDFPGLLERLDGIEGLWRVRFVTSHPRDLSDGLVEAMGALGTVCEHIHLPLQSGSTRVLGLMNRGYTAEEYGEKIGRLRERVPGIALTSDFIAGFPGETEEEHRETLRALEEIRYDGIFAFRYSPRPGTAAAVMGGIVPEGVRLRRLQEILALQDDITLEKNRELEGTTQEVLVEGRSERDARRLTGRTRTNKIMDFKGDEGLVGRLVRVRVKRARRHSLEGELAEEGGRE